MKKAKEKAKTEIRIILFCGYKLKDFFRILWFP